MQGPGAAVILVAACTAIVVPLMVYLALTHAGPLVAVAVLAVALVIVAVALVTAKGIGNGRM